MDSLKKKLKTQLPYVFPSVKRPRVVSTCEYETPQFNEIFEKDVTPEMFQCFDAFFWFTIEGFTYFFPALIRCSFDDRERCIAAIEQLLENFCDYFGSIDDCAHVTQKWERFSYSQIKYILCWLEYLGQELPFRLDETYKNAIEILKMISNKHAE